MGESGLRFGPFTLLPSERRLLRDDQPVALGPRAFDLLCALARRAGGLASKDELLDEVWPRLVVEEANLHVQVSQLRRAIGADAIENLPGRGYRFAWPVSERAVAPDRRLSVIVLPFVEHGPTAGPDYFADAITDDITAQLSRIRGSFVIGTPTAMTFKREPFELFAHARELGVRYALQGSIERDAGSIEVSARLSDAHTGGVIWSDAIELPLTDLRTLRREVVARIAAALDLELIQAEARRVESGERPEVSDLVMQGRAVGGWNWAREHFEQALAIYDRALAIQPDHAEALARRAHMYVVLATAWPGPQIEHQLARAEADALQSLRMDSLDPIAYLALGQTRLMQYRVAEAADAFDSGLALAPNAPWLLDMRAEAYRYAGHSELGFEPARRALAISPRDPHRWVFMVRQGWLHLHGGEYREALAWFERSYALHPHWTTTGALIAVLGHLDERERAQALFGLHQDAETEIHRAWHRASREPLFLQQLREHLFAGLVKAGYRSDLRLADAWVARQLRGGRP
jgi:TolB-like protein/Tfp pilus assembly protein PilF